MEEVRGSSPLSSTAKVLVKAYLILRDHDCPYATEGHLGLTGPFGLDRPRVITIRWASGELPDKSTVVVTSPFFFV
jgi:hypothetical protein